MFFFLNDCSLSPKADAIHEAYVNDVLRVPKLPQEVPIASGACHDSDDFFIM